MNKETAGERKRTVTVTVGPLVWAMIEAEQAYFAKEYDGLEISPTSIVGVAAYKGMAERWQSLKLTPPKGLESLSD